MENRRYLTWLGAVLVVTQLALFVSADECLMAARQRDFPFGFPGQALPSQTFAIITSYKFGCCGNITAWQAFVQHPGVYDTIFQVWRPSPTVRENGIYSLVGENRFVDVFIDDDGLISKSPEPSNILTVQPGDVVGYFTFGKNITQNDDRQGIILDISQSSESVWFHTDTDSNPLNVEWDNCSFSVGTEVGRTLRSLSRAAPVLTARVSSFSCEGATTISPSPSRSLTPSLIATPLSVPTQHTGSIEKTDLPVSVSSSSVSSTAPNISNAALSTPVIASVAVGVTALLLTLMCTLVLAITLAKANHKKQRKLAETSSMLADNQINTLFLKLHRNEAYTSTSLLMDGCNASTINTEDNLAYERVQRQGGENYATIPHVTGECPLVESHLYETVKAANEVIS